MRPSKRKIAQIIVNRLNEGEKPDCLARETAAYLLAESRSKELDSIMRDVKAIRAEGGNVEATVTVAHKLEVSLENDIKQLVRKVKPEAKKITIDKKLDEDLIGGFRLNVIDKSLDLSVRSKLNRLKQLTNEGGI